MQIAESKIELNNINSFEFIKTILDNSVKLIVSDPPYGIDFQGKTSNTDWDKIDNFEEYIYNFLKECKRILTDDGTLWLYIARTKIFEVQRAIEKAGLKNNLENWMTYVRAKGRGANSKLKSQCEEILHITKTNNYKWDMIEYERECVTPYIEKIDGESVPRGWYLDLNDGMRKRFSGLGNACCFTSPFYLNTFEKQIHSTQKPVLLNCMLIMLSSNENDTVYDFFSGSGSSAIASILSKRNFVGCELDKDMYKKSLDWITHIDFEKAKQYVNKRIRYCSDELPPNCTNNMNEIREYESKMRLDKENKSIKLF